MIIDAHAHIMTALQGSTASGPTRSLSFGKARWGERTIQLLPPAPGPTRFPAEALLAQMDWAGVERAVLLQGPFYGEADATVAAAVREFPDRFSGAFAPDPRARAARRQFTRCVDDLGLSIVKLELSEPTGWTGIYPDLRLDAPELDWLFAAANSRGLVVTLDLGAINRRAYQTDAVAAIARRYPALTIVIAHLGQPPLANPHDPALTASWQRQIELGRLENLHFDASALPAYGKDIDEYPYVAAQAWLRRAVDLIGADKIMWGTDAPGLLTSGSYPQLLNWLRRHCDFLSSRQKAQILGENAARVYFNL